MIIKVLAATAALAMLAAGSAKAQDYGTPPYGSSAYASGEGCSGFTIAGGYAGVTLLGIDFGVSGRARINGACGGGASYGPPPPAPTPVYQGPAYPPAYGGGYAQPVAYPQPTYAQPSYGYAPQPCGCAPQYGYAQPY